MLNAAAIVNAASEAAGVNDLGRAAGEGDIVGVGIAAATMLPFGKLAKGGRLLRHVDGGVATADEALRNAERWLGEGYTEIRSGVFRSADNTRQFRMTNSDLVDPKKGPHVHFEAIGSDGRTITQNSHVRLVQ